MAGLARARKHGTKTGKPFGRPKIDSAVEAFIRQSLANGTGTKATAKAAGVGIGTVLRIRGEL